MLVSVSSTASLEALHDAISIRLGIRPDGLFLGETQAAIADVSDLKEGDVLRVDLPRAEGEEDGEAEPAPLGWRHVVRLLLTLIIFVMLNEGFHRLVMRRYKRGGTSWSPGNSDVEYVPGGDYEQ